VSSRPHLVTFWRVVLGAFAVAGAATVALLATATGAAAGGTPDPVPLPSLPAIEQPNAPSARLVPVPSGCAAPAQEQVVFEGSLVVHDVATARFRIRAVRAGSPAGFAVDGLVDVRYGEDVRFLDTGSSYVVGAAVDPARGVLFSSVREPAPLFSGPDVVAAGVSDVRCPVVEDPVRTLRLDGRPVESGVLAPLRSSGRQVARAVLGPIVVAFAVLVALAGLKLLVFAVGRGLRELGWRDEREARVVGVVSSGGPPQREPGDR
jgi:hypothetical protein